MNNNLITRRDQLCNQVHTDLSDLIIETRGMKNEFIVPLIVECKGDAVAVSNYLRGVGYTVNLIEMNAGFLYELIVIWN